MEGHGVLLVRPLLPQTYVIPILEALEEEQAFKQGSPLDGHLCVSIDTEAST
jgi:hypothetical protein